MAEFRCSCGELLVVPSDGLILCLFCRAEYLRGFIVSDLDYVPQQSRPVIKSSQVPVIVNDRRARRFT